MESFEFTFQLSLVQALAAQAAALGITTEDLQSLQTESGDNLESES
jgi:hypothetical protein